MKTSTTTANTAASSGTEVLIPLNKLKKSPRNARRAPHSAASIEAKAASIDAKGILQNLVVEPERDADGVETGCYYVTIGEGRRLAQLLRVKRKRITRTEPIRCVIDSVNDPHEISLDENVTREAMHPADQFEAFRDLAVQKGWGAEEIAARFGVTAQVVRQRLRLAAVSPRLLALYREEELTLEQLMAFGLVDDHVRQEEVYDKHSWNLDPPAIRRALTESHVAASDRRAVFVGAEAYRNAGGTILCDLFTVDGGGGYFEDAALLERLAMAKLEAVADEVRKEGWKWVTVQLDYAYDHGLRRYRPLLAELPATEQAAFEAAEAAYEAGEAAFDAAQEPSDALRQQLAELAATLERLDALRWHYAADFIARGGVFLFLSHDGSVRIERGFIKPEDEACNREHDGLPDDGSAPNDVSADGEADRTTTLSNILSDALVRDLTAHRTMGLRAAVGEKPDIALIAVIHALAAQTFYPYAKAQCLDLRAASAPLGGYAKGIGETAAASLLGKRQAAWEAQMPAEPGDLWDFIAALDAERRLQLLAHCVSVTITAVQPSARSRTDGQVVADRMAAAVGLDMADFWTPCGQAYLERVTKAQILDAVRECVSESDARRLEGLRKGDMAKAAAALLAGRRWLPALLKTPNSQANAAA